MALLNAQRRVLTQISTSVQYLYFLRCSLTLWLALPILTLLDEYTGISSLTRGIFTPPDTKQCFYPVFFVVCVGMVTLLTARVVSLNGAARFDVEPPLWIRKALGIESEQWSLRMLLIAQLPGFFVIYRYYANGLQEKVLEYGFSPAHAPFWEGMGGILAAVGFWWTINGFFYWICLLDGPKTPLVTILFPLSYFPLPKIPSEGLPAVRSAETDFVHKISRWMALVGGKGYSGSGDRLYEGHLIAILSLVAYVLIYLFFFGIAAPLPHLGLAWLAIIVYSGINLAVLPLLFGRRRGDGRLANALAVSCVLSAFGPLFCLVGHAKHLWIADFPVLAPVAVLITLFGFVFTGTAFFADRHRIPVVTAFVVYIMVVQYIWIGPTSAHHPADHTYHAEFNSEYTDPTQPASILARYQQTTCAARAQCPMILVAASGGGLHAGSWAAEILTQLEIQMQADKELDKGGFTFHRHLLYASTVSGSSVGILPFLRQYYANDPFAANGERVPNTPTGTLRWVGQIRRAANCSSLEAVGWGLQYGDLSRLLAPYIPFPFVSMDRSEALETAIQRNMSDRSCNPDFGDDAGVAHGMADPSHFSLRETARTLRYYGSGDEPAYFPAFTFNTTAAETGGRFLLANYENARNYGGEYGVSPAESFLQTYGKIPLLTKENKSQRVEMNADILLATAARLSATFPYVSSAAKIDSGKYQPFPALHFVDGGYYDNDGMSSLIEFLEQALKSNTSTQRTPILLIEIRDSADLDKGASDESFDSQKNLSKDHWGVNDQTKAPLQAFWNGGHVSVTRRNRRELSAVIQSFARDKNLEITHIVFDYQPPPQRKDSAEVPNTNDPAYRRQAAQPLNWHLTPLQMDKITASATAMQYCLKMVNKWAVQADGKTLPSEAKPYTGVSCNRVIAAKNFHNEP